MLRSGIVERGLVPRSRPFGVAPTAREVFDKGNEFIAMWEEHALDVYRRHGLPATPGGWELHADGTRTATYHYGSEREEHGLNSEVGFATSLLRRIFLARFFLNGKDSNAWAAFVQAAEIAQDANCLQVEYRLRPWIGPGRVIAMSRPAGGDKTAADRRAEKSPKVRRWLEIDADIPAAVVAKTERATRIKRIVRNGEHDASEDVISRELPSRK